MSATDLKEDRIPDGTYASGPFIEQEPFIEVGEAPLAYGFEEDTHEYLRSEPCQLDALETRAQKKAVWLLPAHATLTPPPEARDGFARVWDGAAWQQSEDHRGTSYWLPTEGDDWQSPAREMKAVGPLPHGAVTERPEKAVTVQLDEARNAKRVEIAAGYNAALAASLTMPAQTPTAQETSIGAALFAVEDADGLQTILRVHQSRRDALLAAMEAAPTVAEVMAVHVSYAV